MTSIVSPAPAAPLLRQCPECRAPEGALQFDSAMFDVWPDPTMPTGDLVICEVFFEQGTDGESPVPVQVVTCTACSWQGADYETIKEIQ